MVSMNFSATSITSMPIWLKITTRTTIFETKQEIDPHWHDSDPARLGGNDSSGSGSAAFLE